MSWNSPVGRWTALLLLSALALLPFGPGSIGGVTRPDSLSGAVIWLVLALLFALAAIAIALVSALLFVALHLPRWTEPWPYFAGLFFKGLFYIIPVLQSGPLSFSIGHHCA